MKAIMKTASGISLQWPLHSERLWCRYIVHLMKDGGAITFLPDLILSGLMAVLKSTQLAI